MKTRVRNQTPDLLETRQRPKTAGKASADNSKKSTASKVKKVGGYLILEEIGSGGMAVVYRGEQESLGRAVAIKELRKALAKDDTLVTRFEREARNVAALGHQNIIHIYDFIRRANALYIVMEYVEGLDLKEVLTDVHHCSPEVAAVIALQVLRALEYAHFYGVVHRDLKPANVMLSVNGEIKLMDFGIARSDDDEELTATGHAIGTPAYMSPEQVMGKRVDFRSDIFSFGIMFYQMICGERPFVDDSSGGVMQAIMEGHYIPAHKRVKRLPRPLRIVLKRCLAHKPEHRYQETEELRKALEQFVAIHVPGNLNDYLLRYLIDNNIFTHSDDNTDNPHPSGSAVDLQDPSLVTLDPAQYTLDSAEFTEHPDQAASVALSSPLSSPSPTHPPHAPLSTRVHADRLSPSPVRAAVKAESTLLRPVLLLNLGLLVIATGTAYGQSILTLISQSMRAFFAIP